MEWMLMPFRRYAEFSGRSRRKEYWMFTLLMVIVYSAAAVLMFAGGFMNALSGAENPEFGPLFWLGGAIALIFFLVSFVPAIAVTIRRLHDRDMSGWWYLGFIIAGTIPYVGNVLNIVFLVILCLNGTAGPNRFGSDPKNPGSYDVFG